MGGDDSGARDRPVTARRRRFQLRVEGRRRGRSDSLLLASALSETRSAGDFLRGGGGGSGLELELELRSEPELEPASGAELERRLGEAEEDEDEDDGRDEDDDREEELRRSPLGRSELEDELGRFDFDELERSPEGRPEEELLERRRLPSREEEDEDEEDEEEERRRATGVSQYGQTDQRGSTGLPHERQGSLSRCWHSGQRSQSSSIGCSQRGHELSLRRRRRSSDSLISSSRSRRSSMNSGGRRIE